MTRPRPWMTVGTLLAFTWAGSGCYSYRALPLTQINLEKERMNHRRVRFQSDTGEIWMDVREIDMPYLDGMVRSAATPRPAEVMVDLRKARSLAITEKSDAPGEASRRRSLALTEEALRGEALQRGAVTVDVPSGTLTLEPARLEWPYLVGVLRAGEGMARIDVSRVKRMEVHGLDGSKTVGVLLAAAGIYALLGLIAALTKESCPFVYVNRGQGWELVGEAYAGAAFRSIQRDDLLPLPALLPGGVRLRLRNEARETQYTDRAALVLVERPIGRRALSSHKGEIVVVGEPSPALAVVDLQRRDARALVAERDGRTWERDLVAAAEAASPPLREGLVAVFDRPAGGEAILELVAGNTPWLDVVFGRFFAAMGDRLDHYLASGNKPAAAPGIHRWKRREGVDLKVEYLEGAVWREVAMVPTVGPMALRHVAVPLPPGEGRATIRLTGGPGFWRVDQLALSARAETTPEVRRIAPRSARTDEGVDERQTLSAVDGRYKPSPAWTKPSTSSSMCRRPPPDRARRPSCSRPATTTSTRRCNPGTLRGPC